MDLACGAILVLSLNPNRKPFFLARAPVPSSTWLRSRMGSPIRRPMPYQLGSNGPGSEKPSIDATLA